MQEAGPLEPALRGLLAKDPDHRAGVAEARRLLEAVATSDAASDAATSDVATGDAAAAAAPRPAEARRVRSPRTREALHRGGDLARFDRAELRSLASASKAVLGSVAGSVAESVVRETRDQARTLVDKRRAQRRALAHPPEPAPGPPDDASPARTATPEIRPRWRFKRRWVVVPVVVTVLLVVLVLAGLVVLLGSMTGLVGG